MQRKRLLIQAKTMSVHRQNASSTLTDATFGFGCIQKMTTHHYNSLKEILKLVQITLILPLHIAGCERVFSQQNPSCH
jgi:hypothetical protein